MAYNGITGMSDNLYQDINNLDFHQLFSGPLLATVNAQADAAKSTVRFLEHTCIADHSEAPLWVSLTKTDVQSFESFPRDLLLTSNNWNMAMDPLIGMPAPPGMGGNIVQSIKNRFRTELGAPGHYVQGSVVHVTVNNEKQFYRARSKVPGSIGPSTVVQSSSGASVASSDHWVRISQHNVRSLDFSYDQAVTTSSGHQSFNHHTVTIPMMTLVPIPYIRIETLDVEFNVKLTGVEETSRTATNKWKVKTGWTPPIPMPGKGGFLKLKGSFSRKATRGESMKVSRSYDLEVKIHGSQAEMPPGIERMINLLEDLVVEDIQNQNE
tara:strand:+ start:2673 stop:3644 length:972 start_codon:yes stop_codon:yes gene_type:complete